MFRRTSLLILFISSRALAQVNVESGEINLRGTLMFSGKSHARVVLNAGTRAMRTLNVTGEDSKKLLKDYKSGTKVEVCADVRSLTDKSNQDAELLKIRPLAPNEAVFMYSGTLKGCPRNKGCAHFGKEAEAAMSSDQINFPEEASDYFSCKK